MYKFKVQGRNAIDQKLNDISRDVCVSWRVGTNKSGNTWQNAHVCLKCKNCDASIHMNCVEAPLSDEANKVALGDALSKLFEFVAFGSLGHSVVACCIV